MSKKVIGILGGMGPLATADLFQKITLHTVAACDQAHPRVCIDSNTDIADRTAALLHGGEDPRAGDDQEREAAREHRRGFPHHALQHRTQLL